MQVHEKEKIIVQITSQLKSTSAELSSTKVYWKASQVQWQKILTHMYAYIYTMNNMYVCMCEHTYVHIHVYTCMTAYTNMCMHEWCGEVGNSITCAYMMSMHVRICLRAHVGTLPDFVCLLVCLSV
jgi:hypothetical protein